MAGMDPPPRGASRVTLTDPVIEVTDDKITSLPWHVNVDAEGYQETSDAIEEQWDDLVEGEQEYGALFLAGVARRAGEMLGYPEDILPDVPDDAQEAADEYVNAVKYDDGVGTAQALYSLPADASDLRIEYEEAHGEENVRPLIEHIDAVRERWEEYKDENQ